MGWPPSTVTSIAMGSGPGISVRATAEPLKRTVIDSPARSHFLASRSMPQVRPASALVTGSLAISTGVHPSLRVASAMGRER